jgi:hypothetical protein
MASTTTSIAAAANGHHRAPRRSHRLIPFAVLAAGGRAQPGLPAAQDFVPDNAIPGRVIRVRGGIIPAEE